MGYFYSTPESVFGTVPARGERLRLDVLIAQFEVLPESEVLRTPGGQKREHRAREGKTGEVSCTPPPPAVINNPPPPPLFGSVPPTTTLPPPPPPPQQNPLFSPTPPPPP